VGEEYSGRETAEVIRVHVICEGQTEELFVNELLALAFQSKQILLFPSLVGKPGHKGGNINFDRLFPDIRNRLLGDSTADCTTFFDFYGLASSFPGKESAKQLTAVDQKWRYVCDAMVFELRRRLGDEPMRRFVPYVQMDEFEGLLFSEPNAFALALNCPNLDFPVASIRNSFPAPEDSNDSPLTAPSKRILSLFPGYEKPLHGSLVALETGLETLRRECRLFSGGMELLEELGGQIKSV
jgi:hypothetical protein